MEFDRVPPIAKYLSAIFLISRLGFNTAWMFLPVFFERHISSVFLIGVMTSLPAAIPVLTDISVGNLVQRAGERVVIFTGLIINIFPPLFYFTTIPALLVIGKGVEGFMKSFIWNGALSLTMESSNSDYESESISIFFLGANTAAVIGSVLGGYLIAAYGFNIVFVIWGACAALGAIVFLSYIGLKRKQGFLDALEEVMHRRTYRDDYRHIRNNWADMRYPLLMIFTYSVIFSFFWLAVPLLLERVGADFKTMGLIFGLAFLPNIFQFVFGDIADKIGRLKLVTILGVLSTPVLVLMSIYSNIYLIGGLFLLARLLVVGFTPAIHAFYDSRSPDELEGEMVGFMETSKHIGQTLGPIIAGSVASVWSVSASFLSAGFMTFILAIFAFYGVVKGYN